MQDPCGVFELRQYTLRPGRRDELIELFETHLVEPQEDLGMHVVGQFRDTARPDRFVWLRGFRDMPARLAGLTGFYLESDAWARHRDAANATMLDSDDVLLLRPVPGAGLPCGFVVPRPAHGVEPAEPAARYTATIHHLADRADDAARIWLAEQRPALDAGGAEVVGVLRSEHAPNNFPRLPVREDAEVLVVLARHAGPVNRLAQPDTGALAGVETAPVEVLHLEPTARSALR